MLSGEQINMPTHQRLESTREPGQRLGPARHCLIRAVTFESGRGSDPSRVIANTGKGILVNISNGGMCLLIDRQFHVQDTLRIRVPTQCSEATTPTLAEVRWVKEGQLGQHDVYLIGLRFLL